MGDRGQLLKILGVAFGLAAVVGNMIGQGILRLPGLVASGLQDPVLIIVAWLAGGAMAAIASLAYIELGAAIPNAGGPFGFAERAFGRVTGTVVGWLMILDVTITLALLSTVVGEFAVRLLPWLGEPILPALGALGAFSILNWAGTRTSAASQIVFSAAKGLFLLSLAVVFWLASPIGPSLAPAPPPAPVSPMIGIAGIAIAMRAVTAACNGWQHLALYSEEMSDPARALPRAMLGGIASVVALYVLFNVALLNVLTPEQMAQSNLPAADAAAIVLGPAADHVLTAFGILSVSAILAIKLMSAARIGFALGRDGALPSALAWVSSSGTPRVALASIATIAALLVATGTFSSILAMSVITGSLITFTALIAAIWLRRKEPDLKRPYRMPLAPLPAIVGAALFAALLAAMIYEDPANALKALGLLAGLALIAAVQRSARFRSNGARRSGA